MRALVILFLVSIISIPSLVAQPTEKDMARHRKEVLRSLKNQDATISLDTLFNNGKPYAVVRRKNKFESSYQFVSLQGEPLFWVELDINVPMVPGGPPTNSWRAYTFVVDGETELAALPLFLNTSEKDMAREIIRHGLLDENGLVLPKVKVFIERYRKTLPAPEEEAPAPVLPERDRTEPISRKTQNIIVQDNVTIAMVWQKRSRQTKEVRAQLYNSEGKRATTFMFIPGAHNSLEFESYSDGRKHQIQVAPEADPVLEVTAYLVAKGYL